MSLFKSIILASTLLLYTGCVGTGSKLQDSNKSSGTDTVVKDSNNSSLNYPVFTHKNDKYQIFAWNDLGMHCMDGSDYSVFSILPPYNNLITQLVRKSTIDTKPELVTKDVTISYKAEASLHGKYNTSSENKTNFWQYAPKLFNTTLKNNVGLKGNPAPSRTPALLSYQNRYDWWEAEGIPVVPQDDDGTKNQYPMVRVTAKDNEGNILAETTAVLPVSDEMDCRKCHSTAAQYSQAKPYGGYVNHKDKNKDYKYNILRLHDEEHDIESYLGLLESEGYKYKSSLEETAKSGTPILCASCHKSNALGTKGIDGIPSLTSAIHSRHRKVLDPSNGKILNANTNRDACYACHPGQKTQCLRGAMGQAKDENGTQVMQCQSCHGNMTAMGSKERDGWLEQPNCQACHQDGKRYTTAVIDMKRGTLRDAIDSRFATNPNTPSEGISLYRFSRGHGGLQCASCHGSTHAIYGSARDEDNIQSKHIQGHAGTINDCKACHKRNIPDTIKGGPHGMHTPGTSWVHDHKEAVINNGSEECKSCHGKDYRGTPLSKMFTTRYMAGKKFEKGKIVSCYDCHNGPTGQGY